jgi:hypothetical protein
MADLQQIPGALNITVTAIDDMSIALDFYASLVGYTFTAFVQSASASTAITVTAAAAVGDYVEGGSMEFGHAPLVIYPGCYIAFIVRPAGTVTSNTLSVIGSVAFTGYFE